MQLEQSIITGTLCKLTQFMFLLLIEILGVEKSFRKPDKDLCPVLYEKRHQYYSQDLLPPLPQLTSQS